MKKIQVVLMTMAIYTMVFAAEAPKGAKVLFDGKDTSAWQHPDGTACRWKLGDDAMEVGGGNLVTKEKFQNFTFHIEFMTPKMPDAKGQGRGNSGVYLQDRYEIQVLDSYGIEKLSPGDCGGIYSQKPADKNVCKPPGEWQTYDITFKAAKFDADGKKTANARVTVKQNGEVIHSDVEIKDKTGGGKAEGAQPGPLQLQDHGNPVRYRNIWIIEEK